MYIVADAGLFAFADQAERDAERTAGCDDEVAQAHRTWTGDEEDDAMPLRRRQGEPGAGDEEEERVQEGEGVRDELHRLRMRARQR